MNLGIRRTNTITRKEGQEVARKAADKHVQEESAAPSPQQKQKVKHSRKNQDKNLPPIHNDQTRLSVDHVEPNLPSNTVKNTHKTRI